MAVGLCHAQIDRKVGTTREMRHMLEHDLSAPVALRQTVNAQPATKAAAIEHNGFISERRKVYQPRDDVGFDLERALTRFIKPKINTGPIAGRHRTPAERRPGGGRLHPPLGI